MAALLEEWAGKERCFELNFGDVLDLQEATGCAIGQMFIRLVSGAFRIEDTYHTIRLALVGGGMSALDAKRLMQRHFDTRPLMENAALAGQIFNALMIGIEETGGDAEGGGADVEPYKFSEVSQLCRVFNLSPIEMREMRYSDFVNMVRGFNAASETKAPHISEREFLDILEKYEPEAIT